MSLRKATVSLLGAVFCTIGFAVTAGLPATAQTVEATSTGTRISASAEATIAAKPDQALLSIGVTTQAPTSQEAGAKNAQETDKLLTALKAALGRGGEFKTSGYWINPQYANPAREGNRITSYVARNSVEVSIHDLSIVSSVIDAAVKAGSNSIGALRFTLKDQEAAQTRALVEATSQAREKAAAMARALGLKVSRVVSVSDASAPPVSPLLVETRSAMAAGRADTPVEAGMIEVQAKVTVVVEAR